MAITGKMKEEGKKITCDKSPHGISMMNILKYILSGVFKHIYLQNQDHAVYTSWYPFLKIS